ncbi:MAG: alpha/beta fold hydrolase [Candidatus Binataceae bacterium]|nr:alpha/beta fold hydrolase [Candidatus Binataceae bacterium]
MADRTVEPFKIQVSDEVLRDLRERLERTRFPDEVPDSGWEYGTNLTYLKRLVDYWRTTYDWRTHEAALNRFAHFRTSIDGLGIHFIHEPGRGPNPKPLLLSHGWPGSVVEFMRIIPMLTDPGAHGGDPAHSFTVIAPSLPGYGFSDHPRTRAMNIQAIAEIFHQLMTGVLGYSRYGAQGGDWGSAITSRLGEVHGASLYGIHLNLLFVGGRRDQASELTAEEKVFLADMDHFRREETGYQWIQGTRPQTLAYGLNDSPAGLAAWIVEKFRTWSDCNGEVETRFTKDELLTNIMVYWVTQSINSSTRLYYESRHHPWRPDTSKRIETPTAAAIFPREILKPPRAWAERAFNIQRWTAMPAGGHFAAMEEPAALAADVRAFFNDLK